MGVDSSQPQRSGGQATALRPLRIWPAVLLLAVLWGLRIGGGFVSESSLPVMMVRFMGPLILAGLIALWWLFFSRATWREKGIGFVALIAILAGTTLLADKSIKVFGTVIFAIPWGMSAFAAALIVFSRLPTTGRTWLALVAAFAAFGYWDLVRTDEIRGDFRTAHNWRWKPTAEEAFLESLKQRPTDGITSDFDEETLAEPEWPAFRGPDRSGVQPEVALGEQWGAEPPKERWRVRVGPAWSSFAVAGGRLFTQEQRGENEVVVCYDADSGSEVWSHQYASRFWEVVGGAGPRATPTISGGLLFSLGANGILCRLDPFSGEALWQRDISQDAERQPPQWGFASSPLVVGGLVIVHGGGAADKGLLAYDIESGELRWSAAAGDHSYSSPQLAVVDGKSCLMFLSNHGMHFVDPASGADLGKHEWQFEGYRVVQPLVFEGSSALLGTAMGTGTRRIELQWDGEQFLSQESWTSRQMSPYFNDYVAHQGFLYGFDNNIFACVDLSTGKRKWKKGRYGNGQVLLLPRRDQLLVISEDGELVLLRATPDGLVELARQQVLEGRTWNHPVLVGRRLYVRNAEEAACFEMPILDDA